VPLGGIFDMIWQSVVVWMELWQQPRPKSVDFLKNRWNLRRTCTRTYRSSCFSVSCTINSTPDSSSSPLISFTRAKELVWLGINIAGSTALMMNILACFLSQWKFHHVLPIWCVSLSMCFSFRALNQCRVEMTMVVFSLHFNVKSCPSSGSWLDFGMWWRIDHGTLKKNTESWELSLSQYGIWLVGLPPASRIFQKYVLPSR